MQKIVVLTGAGISAESGLKTFRDAGGLWEGFNVMEVASPQGWRKNKNAVLEFYNQRRKQLKEVNPNKGHLSLVALEQQYDVSVITQNVDDLHERAGSNCVIHLHGELLKSRSSIDESLVYDCAEDIIPGDTCEKGSQLRPHIVWFGEFVPMLEKAAQECAAADIMMIIGTSMTVYPAASLVAYAPLNIPIYYIDPAPQMNFELSQVPNLHVINEKASIGVPMIVKDLINAD